VARILFLGMDSPKHSGLRFALQSLGHSLVISESIVLSSVDVAFCNLDIPEYRVILRSLKSLRPALPVVAVTLQPGDRKMLDALESGASDYCCAPFEAAQLASLLAGLGIPGVLTHKTAA